MSPNDKLAFVKVLPCGYLMQTGVTLSVFFIVLTVLEINELQRDYKVQDYNVCALVICSSYNNSCNLLAP